MDYNSKYNGAEVEAILDRASDCITKGESVDFATDLTGVPEATHEEFTYRPSAGRKSIRDKSAVIRRIKGNSLVWNQGAYKDKRTIFNGVSVSHDSTGMCELTGTLNNNTWQVGITDMLYESHVYLHIIELFSMGNLSSINFGNLNEYNSRFDFREIGRKYSIVKRKTNVSATYIGGTGEAGVDMTGVKCRYRIIDLTLMFGTGNEPTTIEDFYARIPEGIDINAYNEGQLISMNVNAIETNGFNQFNGTYAEVIGGQTYYLGGTYTSVGFTAKLGGTIEDITIPSDSLYSPTQSGYIYASGKNICINLSHSGVRNGEYEPYWKSINDLSVIKKYFHDGMRSAGSAYDEIMFDESREKWIAIRRIGSVDLGSLNWNYTSTEGEQRYVSYGLQGKINVPSSNGDVANTRTTRYLATYFNGMWDNTLDKTLAVHTNGAVAIKDLLYTNATTFKNSLQGVMLYYELAEPIVTEIDDVVDFAYAIDDFGTERILSDGTSAPFKADIVYQFNAEGRIRDNSRNIDSLEGQIQTLYQGVDVVGSIANTINRNTISFDKLNDVPDADGLIKGRDTKAYIDTAIKNATPFVVDPDKNVIFPEKVVARSFEDRDGNAVMLAKDIPTEVATATQKDVGVSSNYLSIVPNVMYEITNPISGEFIMPKLFVGDDKYDNVWMIRILTAMPGLTINFGGLSVRSTGYIDIKTTCCLELYLRKGSDGVYYCDWKTYS